MHLNGHNLVMLTTKTVGHDLIYQLLQTAYKKYEQTSRNYIIKTRTTVFDIVKSIVQDLTAAALGKCFYFFL